MTIPGLALFYGGLVRSKNMLSVLMQVFVVTAMIYVLWAIYGYSVAFTAATRSWAASARCSCPASRPTRWQRPSARASSFPS
jgi:ammonia channel protein AmtB